MSNIILLLILYAGFAAEYAANKFLARHLDLDGLGDFNVAISIATICSMVFVFGSDAGSNRFIPKYLEDREWGKIKGYIVYFLKLSLVISISTAILSLAAGYLLRLYHLEQLLHESYFAMVLAPALSVLIFLGGLLLSMHRQFSSSITTELLKFVLFLSGVSLWLSFRSSIDEYQAIGLLLVSLLIIIAIQSWLTLKAVPFDFFAQKAQMRIPEWRAVCKPMLVIGLANNFISVIEMWSLELLDRPEKSVGAFSLLVFISSILWLNYTALYYIVASRISTIEHDRRSLRKSYSYALLWLSGVNILVAFLLFFNAELLLGWFHADMIAYANWLRFFLVGSAVNSILQLASPFLRFGGYEKEDSVISSRVLMISIIFAPTMVLLFGIDGALFSSVALLFVRGVWYSWRLWKLQGVSLVCSQARES